MDARTGVAAVIIYSEREELVRELLRADWRLSIVLEDLAREAALLDLDVMVTSVYRTDAETRAIYELAGRTPPGASVHGTSPVRGVDAVPFETRGAGGPLPPRSETALHEIAQALAAKVCLRIRYPRGLKAVLWHDVGGGAHWHVQVPYDGLELVADVFRV